jgi:DNA-binding response OmpR family regulator/predicted ATPase
MGLLQLRTCSVDLGHRQVLRGGAVVPLSRLEAGLLEYLALRPHQDIPRDELWREVWQGTSGSPSRAVDLTVTRLRRKLGEPDPPEHLLTSHGVGYRFAPPAPARPATPVSARPLVEIPTGSLDLEGRVFLRLDGAQLPLTRLDGALLEELISGAPVPMEELASRLWGRGRHRQALTAALGRLRKKIEPDPERSTALVTVRGTGVRLVVGAAGERSPPRALATSFVETPALLLAEDAMRRHRLLTLRGPGGIGKTRLARALADRWLVGDPSLQVCFCALQGAADERSLLQSVGESLQIEPDRLDLEQVEEALAECPAGTLLVLDNFEHLVPLAGLIERWALCAPELRIVVTSRLALGLLSEHCLELGPMSVESGARLFCERSGAPACPAVRALVARLDGLPLAIELAAARARTLGPESLLERIGERLDLLVRPFPGALSPHTTLRGAFDWSWELLSPAERRALAWLSVLAGPFDLVLARALLGEEGEPLVCRLEAHSLVQRAPGGWQLLETVREYAAEKLLLMGERQPALGARTAAVLSLAERHVEALEGPGSGCAVRALRQLKDELYALYTTAEDAEVAARAALWLSHIVGRRSAVQLLQEGLQGRLARGVGPELAARLRLRLGQLLAVLGRIDEAQPWLEQAWGQDISAGVRAKMQLLRASHLEDSDPDQARAMYEDARATFSAAGMAGWATRALCRAGLFELCRGERSGRDLVARALEDARATGESWLLATVLWRNAELARLRGDLAIAGRQLDEALALAALGESPLLDRELALQVASLDQARGALAAAERGYRTCLQRAQAVADDRRERGCLHGLVQLHLERGQLEQARGLIGGSPPPGTVGERALCGAALVLLEGEPAAARSRLLALPRPLALCHHAEHSALLAVASATLGLWDEAESHLATLSQQLDLTAGGERLLALCQALLQHARSPETELGSVLAAGALVRSDDGLLIERPYLLNLVRTLLVRRLDTRRDNLSS